MRNIVPALAIFSALALSACQQQAATKQAQQTAADKAMAQAKAYDAQIKNMPAPIVDPADKNGENKGKDAAFTHEAARGAP